MLEQSDRGDTARAEEFLEDLIDFHRDYGGLELAAKSLCDLAVRARDRGFDNLHLEWSSRATQLCPEDGWSWAQLGNALSEDSRSSEAKVAFEKAIEFGKTAVGRSGLADLWKRLGQTQEALASYDEVIAEFPQDAVARNGRSEVLRELGRVEEALAAYDAVISEFPRDAVARTGRSEVLQELGRVEEALASYDAVISEFPREVVARTGRSEVLRELGRVEEALASYDAVIAEFPRDVVARNGRSEVLRELGRVEEALASYDEVISEFPRNVVARTGRSEVLRDLGQLQEALAAYDETAALFPHDAVVRNGRANVLALLGRGEEALAMLPAVAPTRDHDWTGFHIRGMIFARQAKLEEAKEVFVTGVHAKLAPRHDAYFRSALAVIVVRLKRFEEAAEILAPISGGRQELPANVFRFHAFGALGRRAEAEKVDQKLAEVSRPAQVVELRAEFRRRFLEGRPPERSDDWIWAQELDLLAVA